MRRRTPPSRPISRTDSDLHYDRRHRRYLLKWCDWSYTATGVWTIARPDRLSGVGVSQGALLPARLARTDSQFNRAVNEIASAKPRSVMDVPFGPTPATPSLRASPTGGRRTYDHRFSTVDCRTNTFPGCGGMGVGWKMRSRPPNWCGRLADHSIQLSCRSGNTSMGTARFGRLLRVAALVDKLKC